MDQVIEVATPRVSASSDSMESGGSANCDDLDGSVTGFNIIHGSNAPLDGDGYTQIDGLEQEEQPTRAEARRARKHMSRGPSLQRLE
jgi:hypothetical protein